MIGKLKMNHYNELMQLHKDILILESHGFYKEANILVNRFNKVAMAIPSGGKRRIMMRIVGTKDPMTGEVGEPFYVQLKEPGGEWITQTTWDRRLKQRTDEPMKFERTEIKNKYSDDFGKPVSGLESAEKYLNSTVERSMEHKRSPRWRPTEKTAVPPIDLPDMDEE